MTDFDDEDNRRGFYRVSADALLNYKLIKQQVANQRSLKNLSVAAVQRMVQSLFEVSAKFRLMSELYELEVDAGQAIHASSSQSRAFKTYLAALNKKIDLIARAIVADDPQLSQQKSITISISEGGVAIPSDRAIEEDRYVAIQLLLLPDHLGLFLLGRVTQCSAADTGFNLQICFEKLMPRDQQMLSRYVLQSQFEAQRKRGEQ